MNSRQPLNDSWLFWNAERLEEFPHVCEDDHACAPADGDADDGEGGSARLAMLEDLLLYVAGVSAAMTGVGLAVLIGSFISAYAALNSPDAADRAAVPAPPYQSLERSAPHAGLTVPEAIEIEPAKPGTAPGGQMSPVRRTGYSGEASGT